MSDNKMTLYTHTEHPHMVHNVNVLREIEQRTGGTNQKIAVWVTKLLSDYSPTKQMEQ